MTDELIKRLKEAAQAATPQNLDTAQEVERYEDGSHITCPTCGGEGYAELQSDFCNYDGKAIGVQFYGIGPEHLAAEAYFRAASPAAILDLIALIEQQAAALEAANARIAELEAAIRKQANAARSLADATIRDASIRQGLAEKAYAESSPEVLASERQANAMLTEENERLTARLTALESAANAEPVAEIIRSTLDHPFGTHDLVAATVLDAGKRLPEGTKLYTHPHATESDRRDAERYRWLKAWDKLDGWTDEAIDRQAAIDAALSQMQEPGGEG